MTREQALPEIMAAARRLAAEGWLWATSGNLSVRLASSPLTIAITRSGCDKSALSEEDIIALIGSDLVWGDGRPSAETGVHQRIYTATEAGAVIHVHTPANNVVAALAGGDMLSLSGNEMLKALGFWAEDAIVALPLVPNYADLDHLAEACGDAVNPSVPGLLIENHGLYAFGTTMSDALRHAEAFEFLFQWRLGIAQLSVVKAISI